MAENDLVAIIEAAYAVEGEEDEWLAGLARNVYEHAGLKTIGAYAQTYSLRRGGVSFGGIQFVGAATDRMQALHDELGAYYATRPDRILATYGETDEGLALSLPGGERAEIAKILSKWGVGDMYGINARSPSGAGCLLCVYLPPRHRPIPGGRRASFARIARHVSAGLRLRTRLAGGAPEPEAILDSQGTVVHANGSAKPRAARDALSAAATTLVRTRAARRRSDPDRLVATWKGLVDARWSLVDHVGPDGSSCLVAHRNDLLSAAIGLLTERERQVVALAAMGLANKVIAYELGIATSTVGVLVSRAVARLGVSSRRELLDAYRAASQ